MKTKQKVNFHIFEITINNIGVDAEYSCKTGKVYRKSHTTQEGYHVELFFLQNLAKWFSFSFMIGWLIFGCAWVRQENRESTQWDCKASSQSASTWLTVKSDFETSALILLVQKSEIRFKVS